MPSRISPPIETGTLKNTASLTVTFEMLGSVTPTIGELIVVEKLVLGAKSDTSVCGVMFCSELFVITTRAVVVPTAKCPVEFKSSQA